MLGRRRLTGGYREQTDFIRLYGRKKFWYIDFLKEPLHLTGYKRKTSESSHIFTLYLAISARKVKYGRL